MKNCHKSVYGWFIGKSGSLKTALYFCLFVKGKKKKKENMLYCKKYYMGKFWGIYGRQNEHTS